MDIHKVIGKIPFKPKRGYVLPRHHFTGPYNPLHMQLYLKDNPLPGNEPYNAVGSQPYSKLQYHVEYGQIKGQNFIIRM